MRRCDDVLCSGDGGGGGTLKRITSNIFTTTIIYFLFIKYHYFEIQSIAFYIAVVYPA